MSVEPVDQGVVLDIFDWIQFAVLSKAVAKGLDHSKLVILVFDMTTPDQMLPQIFLKWFGLQIGQSLWETNIEKNIEMFY